MKLVPPKHAQTGRKAAKVLVNEILGNWESGKIPLSEKRTYQDVAVGYGN
jgi:hypothetical protein